MTLAQMERDADISLDEEYRYSLFRRWSEGPTVCWIMLNPSTADAYQDDPTIRRCIGFSQRWGYGALVVVNLFARRCSRPIHLKDPGDPVGWRNENVLLSFASSSLRSIAAWGAHPLAKEPGLRLAARLEDLGVELQCLGTTKDGAPLHPLARGRFYVPGDTEPVRWKP